MLVILQSFALSIEQSLTKRLVLRNCLQYLTITGDVTNRPLTKPRTAQPKHIAEYTTHTHTTSTTTTAATSTS